MKTLLTLTLCALVSAPAFAEIKDDAHDATVKSGNAIKKAGRSASDEACPLVNGKVKCAAKKMKHRAQNASDKMSE